MAKTAAANTLRSSQQTELTEGAASFVEQLRYEDLPAAAIEVGSRCVLDGVGLYIAGSTEPSVRILTADALDQGGRQDALLLRAGTKRVPAAIAARVLGTAGHAHDWDDSQVSVDPKHVYGLLTHPTIPPLTSSLVISQRIGNVSGQDFMLAFQTGFEVECKISEWMLPAHYRNGMHSSGTVGTFGAYAAAAKLMGLNGERLRNGFGIAASMAAGIRANFGTMTKPFHVGRAAENGVTAALLAQRGFTADPSALDGQWGFCRVLGGGVSTEKLAQGFGRTFSIVEPGVSIKPYPCGVLTHPTIDLMHKLVTDNDLSPADIAGVDVFAGSNILEPIRYPIAENHLEAKFSLPAVLAMIALARRAGKVEFEDEFVGSSEMQSMQRRITTSLDPEIEAMGFDKMRSRIEIRMTDGRSVSGWADERYRGGPDNPLSDAELEAKVRACCAGVLEDVAERELIRLAWDTRNLTDVSELARALQA